MKRLIKFLALSSVALLGALAVPAASATPVCAGALLMNPGDTVVMGAGAFGDCTGTAVASTLLASLSAPFTTSLGLTSGTLISAVYRENSAGTLDFYYQVALNTTSTNCPSTLHPTCDPIARETNTNFNWLPSTLDTTYAATRGDAVGPFSAGTIFPITADRNGGGDIVGFSFNPPDGAKIPPGSTSAILIVSTNATTFTSGNSTVIDGGAGTIASFAPTASSTVPEPGTLSLLAFGLMGGSRALRRKWTAARKTDI